jgi:hypothetical protein
LIDNSDIHINQFFGQGKLPFNASAERAANAHARVVRDARGDGASWLKCALCMEHKYVDG